MDALFAPIHDDSPVTEFYGASQGGLFERDFGAPAHEYAVETRGPSNAVMKRAFPGSAHLHSEATNAAAAGAGAAAWLAYSVVGVAWTAAAVYGTYKWFTRKDCVCK